MSPRSAALALLLGLAFASPAAAQTPPPPYTGANFLGITRSQTTALGAGSFEPPDSMGAVGPNAFAQLNNGSFTVFSKAGAVVQQKTDGAFWTAAGVGITSANLSDPRILYDPIARRWVAVQISTNETTNNRILIARSETSDPAGAWKAVAVTATNNRFADYPTLGMTADNVAVGTVNFSPTGTVTLYNLPKANLYAATPTTTDLTRFDRSQDSVGSLIQPTVNYGPSTGSMVVMSPSNTSFTNYIRSTVSNPGSGAATYPSSSGTNVPINPYAFAPNATQPGSSNTLDTIDDRFYASVIHQGNLLYMANVVNSGAGRAGIRFTVANATTNTVVFQTTLAEAFADYFYPAVGVNAAGDIVIGMNLTRTTGNPNGTLNVSSAAIVGSTSNFTSWTFNTPTVLATGLGPYTGSRWGDYSATTLDPADPGIFWTIQELTASSGSTSNWGTQVTEVIPVKAGELRWQAAAAGAFGTGANWFGGAAPAAADHVLFSRWSLNNYQVDLPAGTTTNDRLSVRQTGTGTVTFNVPAGATWALASTSASAPSFAASEFQGESNVVVSGGGTLATRYAAIAGQAGGTATVTVTGGGTQWANANDLYLGGTAAAAGGVGTLSVQNGATVTVGGQLQVWRDNGGLAVVSVGNASNPATLVVGQLANAAGTTPVVSLANPGSVLRVNGAGTSAFTGAIGGAGAIDKQGAGTLTLGGANTYTGGTTIGGGVLQLGAADVLPDSGPVTLSGGTLSTGAGVGFGDTVGALNLTAASTIALGTTSHTLTFTGITGTPTVTLTVTGWAGTGGETGDAGKIYFAGLTGDPNATYAGLLSAARFAGQLNGAIFIATSTLNVYELVPVPVPEPATVLAVAAAALGVGGLVRRRLGRDPAGHATAVRRFSPQRASEG